jgi:hypothetical protein
MLRSRSRQAEAYAGQDLRVQVEQSEKPVRAQVISLPTLQSVYGGRPVTYRDGRLMAGDEVVRIRKEGRS